MNSGICFVISSLQHLSINSEFLNVQKPGPRFVSLLSKDIDRVIAQVHYGLYQFLSLFLKDAVLAGQVPCFPIITLAFVLVNIA